MLIRKQPSAVENPESQLSFKVGRVIHQRGRILVGSSTT